MRRVLSRFAHQIGRSNRIMGTLMSDWANGHSSHLGGHWGRGGGGKCVYWLVRGTLLRFERHGKGRRRVNGCRSCGYSLLSLPVLLRVWNSFVLQMRLMVRRRRCNDKLLGSDGRRVRQGPRELGLLLLDDLVQCKESVGREGINSLLKPYLLLLELSQCIWRTTRAAWREWSGRG